VLWLQTRAVQQLNLKKKLKKHEKSAAHKSAAQQNLVWTQKQESRTTTGILYPSHGRGLGIEKTSKLFKITYIVQAKRPFSAFCQFCNLMLSMSIEFGLTYCSSDKQAITKKDSWDAKLWHITH